MSWARWLRRLLVAAIILIAVGVPALLLVGQDTYTAYLRSEVTPIARQHGVILNWRDTDISSSGVNLSWVDIAIPKAIFSVHLDSLQCNPLWGTLLSELPQANILSNLYRGEIEVSVAIKDRQSFLPQKAAIRHLDFSLHPQLRALGISKGVLDLSIPSLTYDALNPVDGQGDLKISGTNLSQPIKIPARMISSPIDLTIPAIEDLTVAAHFDLAPTRLAVTPLTISSSMGEIRGRLIFGREAGSVKFSRIDGELSIQLTPSGLASIGAWLPIISNGALNNQSARFSVGIRGGIDRPAVSWREL